MSDEYLGHSNDRVKFDSRYIGVSTSDIYPYYSATPNIIIKYDASMWFNHDFYFPGSAYMTKEPTMKKEYGGFVSTSGPDSAFRMPRDAQPVSCHWVSASDIEPYYGKRNMDVVQASASIPNGGWEYITYPHMTAQTNDVSYGDITTWGSGTCEIYRFYSPSTTCLNLIANNSNYTAVRNFYCPELQTMYSGMSDIDWSSAPLPHISHNICEIENFYAPKLVTHPSQDTRKIIDGHALTSLKNVFVSSAGIWLFQILDDYSAFYPYERHITNYTAYYPDKGLDTPFGMSGSLGNRRMYLNGDIVLHSNTLTSKTACQVMGKAFYHCTIGNETATNIYFGPKNLAIYENSSMRQSAFSSCSFCAYPVKFYTCFQP